MLSGSAIKQGDLSYSSIWPRRQSTAYCQTCSPWNQLWGCLLLSFLITIRINRSLQSSKAFGVGSLQGCCVSGIKKALYAYLYAGNLYHSSIELLLGSWIAFP